MCPGRIFKLLLFIACGRTVASYQTGTTSCAGMNTPLSQYHAWLGLHNTQCSLPHTHCTLSWREAGRQAGRDGGSEPGMELGRKPGDMIRAESMTINYVLRCVVVYCLILLWRTSFYVMAIMDWVNTAWSWSGIENSSEAG